MTVWTGSPRSDLKTNWVQCDQSQRSQDVGRDGDEGGGELSVISTEMGGL